MMVQQWNMQPSNCAVLNKIQITGTSQDCMTCMNPVKITWQLKIRSTLGRQIDTQSIDCRHSSSFVLKQPNIRSKWLQFPNIPVGPLTESLAAVSLVKSVSNIHNAVFLQLHCTCSLLTFVSYMLHCGSSWQRVKHVPLDPQKQLWLHTVVMTATWWMLLVDFSS